MAETELLIIFLETGPRRYVSTSRDRLETETSRLRPQPCIIVTQVCVRLSTETQTHESEVRRLTEEVASRDRTATELTTELERVRQEMSELTNRYHTAPHITPVTFISSYSHQFIIISSSSLSLCITFSLFHFIRLKT